MRGLCVHSISSFAELAVNGRHRDPEVVTCRPLQPVARNVVWAAASVKLVCRGRDAM